MNISFEGQEFKQFCRELQAVIQQKVLEAVRYTIPCSEQQIKEVYSKVSGVDCFAVLNQFLINNK